jgi:hypothetical protein
MKITFSSYSGKFYWHVLMNGDTVGRIQLEDGGWRFTTSGYHFLWLTESQQNEIRAAADERTALLNITLRMTS